MRKLILLIFIVFSFLQLNAQELNCTISINSDKIPGSNKQIFTTLQNSLNEFVSQRRWTPYNYKQQERINCNFTIIILEQKGNDFKGSIQIQSSRPVYNSTYLTPVLNFKDDNFSFKYTEFEPLRFNETNFESNLVSIISFYTYIVLGMDADTFSLNGGTPYYTKAQNILVQAQQSGYAGWNQTDGSRSRFVLIDNILSPTYSDFRNVLFNYHFKGLDQMHIDKKMAKETIGETIFTLKSIHDRRPNAFLVRIFLDAKSDEIVDIFSDGPRYDTFKLKENLLKISPLNASKWNKIK